MKLLPELPAGSKGEIKDFDSELNKEFIYDIMDHGVVPGISIVMIDNSPESDKVIFSIGSTLISLRKKDARYISIT